MYLHTADTEVEDAQHYLLSCVTGPLHDTCKQIRVRSNCAALEDLYLFGTQEGSIENKHSSLHIISCRQATSHAWQPPAVGSPSCSLNCFLAPSFQPQHTSFAIAIGLLLLLFVFLFITVSSFNNELFCLHLLPVLDLLRVSMDTHGACMRMTNTHTLDFCGRIFQPIACQGTWHACKRSTHSAPTLT